MKYKGIIFDLDGVLCSTDRFHFEAWKQTAEEVGAPFDETINMKLRGVSRMESLEIILSGSSKTFTDAEKERLATEKNDRYRKPNNPRHARFCANHLQNTADSEDRGIAYHPKQHDRDHLYLLNIVRASRNQGCCRKPMHFSTGKRQHFAKSLTAQIFTDRCRRAGRKEADCNRAHCHQQRKAEHFSARF